MQKHRTNRPAVSSTIVGRMIASTLLACTMLASALPAQARPTRQARDSARAEAGGSQPSRRQPMGPGMRGKPGMQGRGMPGMRGRRMQGMAPTGRGGSPATAMLRMREGLHLTDDQVRRLQAIESSANRPTHSAEMLRARADMMEAMRGDGNIDGARAAMDRMNRLRTEQSLAGLEARQDARNVLTPDQRSRIDHLAGNARRGAAGNVRPMERNARRMALRNRDVARRGVMRGGSPGSRTRLQGLDARPNAMRVLPPGVRRGRMMTRFPQRGRDVRARDARVRELRDHELRARDRRVRRD